MQIIVSACRYLNNLVLVDHHYEPYLESYLKHLAANTDPDYFYQAAHFSDGIGCETHSCFMFKTEQQAIVFARLADGFRCPEPDFTSWMNCLESRLRAEQSRSQRVNELGEYE